MSKQVEDTLYEIHQEVEKNGLRRNFDKQLRKMSNQSKHNHKTVSERWEYALKRIKE